MTEKNDTGFRYDINILRAIAIVGVVLYHYQVPYLSGGFAGVDVFFVISGYLMTRIVSNGIQSKKFSFLSFYRKRVERIVPALLFLILVLSVACFFLYFPDDYRENEKNAVSSLLFLSNIFYWANSGYFDPASDTNLLLHTWSLSVEWQFYMLYPVVLLLLSRIFSNRLKYLLFFTGTTVVLFLGAVLFTRINPTASFYLLPSRAWEMLLGGIAFLLEDYTKGWKYRRGLALIGYGGLFISLFIINDSMAWPGKFTAIPVFTTFLIIVANDNKLTIIKQAGVQFIGKISYSLYLWHWPVYVISQYFGIELNLVSIPALMGISLLLGYLSFRYIESFRVNHTRTILVAVLICVVFSGVLSYLNINHVMFNDRALYMADYRKYIDKDKGKEQFGQGSCFISLTSKEDGQNAYDKVNCLKIDQDKKNVLLIGDSHAAQLSQSLRTIFSTMNINLIHASSTGCFPLVAANGDTRCHDIVKYVYQDFLVKHVKNIPTVVLSANWVNLTVDNRTTLVMELNNTISYLKALHVNVIIIGQSETYKLPYPTVLAKEYQYGMKFRERFMDDQSLSINKFLQKNLAPYYVDIYNYTEAPGVSAQNVPYMFDENHLTSYGADLTTRKVLANPLAKQLFN